MHHRPTVAPAVTWALIVGGTPADHTSSDAVRFTTRATEVHRGEVTPNMRQAGLTAHVTTAHRANDNRIFRKECVSLAEAGIDVRLVAVADESGVVDGVRLHALPRHGSRLARMALGPVDAWRALRSIRPAVVHVHDPELIPLAIAWKWLHGARFVFDAHEDLAKQVMGKPYIPARLRPFARALARGLERLVERQADLVVAATPSIARIFPRAHVVLVQNFPWLRDFPEPTPLPEHSNSAVYVGGIAESRGALQMLEAVQLSATSPQLILAGPVASESLRQQLTSSPAKVDYRGTLPASEVPSIVNDGAVGMVLFHPLPNNLEAQPTKIFEYMAAERPFICSDFPFWRELIGGFDCGVFVDPLDPHAIAQALDGLLSDHERSVTMGRNGRRAVVENFSFENEAVRLVDATRRLLASQTAEPGHS